MGIVTIVHERVGMVSGSSVDKCPRQASSTSRDLSRLLCHSYLIQSADSSLTSPHPRTLLVYTSPLFKSFCRREFPHFLLSHHTSVFCLPHLPPSSFSFSLPCRSSSSLRVPASPQSQLYYPVSSLPVQPANPHNTVNVLASGAHITLISLSWVVFCVSLKTHRNVAHLPHTSGRVRPLVDETRRQLYCRAVIHVNIQPNAFGKNSTSDRVRA